MFRFLLLALACMLTAQEPRFDARSRLVLLPTSVTDAQGRPVDGLESPDFLVLDNGLPQAVTVDTVDTGGAPIALVIAVQASDISAAVLEKVRKIPAMIQPLVTGDRGCAALVAFDEHVRWLQDCTGDTDALDKAFQELRPRSDLQGCMLDAVGEAIERLRGRPNTRRVLLLVSETRDRGSKAELDSVTMAAQTAGVTIYAATYSAFRTAFTTKGTPATKPQKRAPRPTDNPMGTLDGAAPTKLNPRISPPEQRVDILAGIGELIRLGKTNTTQALVSATGGVDLPFLRQKGLETAIEKLGAELHTEYILSFTPSNADAGYHRLEVRLRRGVDFRIRARPGYWLAGK